MLGEIAPPSQPLTHPTDHTCYGLDVAYGGFSDVSATVNTNDTKTKKLPRQRLIAVHTNSEPIWISSGGCSVQVAYYK